MIVKISTCNLLRDLLRSSFSSPAGPVERVQGKPRSSEVPGSHNADVIIGNVACLASSREGRLEKGASKCEAPRAGPLPLH